MAMLYAMAAAHATGLATHCARAAGSDGDERPADPIGGNTEVMMPHPALQLEGRNEVVDVTMGNTMLPCRRKSRRGRRRPAADGDGADDIDGDV